MLCCTCHHVYVTCYCGLVWCESVLLESFISWLVLCHAVQLSDFQKKLFQTVEYKVSFLIFIGETRIQKKTSKQQSQKKPK